MASPRRAAECYIVKSVTILPYYRRLAKRASGFSGSILTGWATLTRQDDRKREAGSLRQMFLLNGLPH
ncbi:hypothetical protein Pla144_11860 [Bythopirellula polymerisocia]|uniref:Uncharacterized protein n=1 Tax=Bythopirellula polymerisocia TaxID=2528003 RepID=A0A5C6D0K3_9BACT|nr:hypothetical protein Pla144_11860 [Bythopirellula polymerisocia]